MAAHTAEIPNEPNLTVLLESQNQSLVLSISLLAFGVFVIVAALWRVDRAHLTEAGALRLVGATVVVVMAVFLCTAGFTLEQITPAIGLLGTMGGYLLGRSERDSGDKAPARAGDALVPAKPAGDASAGGAAAKSDKSVKA